MTGPVLPTKLGAHSNDELFRTATGAPSFEVSLNVRRNPADADLDRVSTLLDTEPTEVRRQNRERHRNGDPNTDWAI